jgi:CHAD domain-containing protein
MSRRTDAQRIILSAASRRDDRGVELPANIKGEAARPVPDKAEAPAAAKKLRYAAEFFAGAFPCKKSARRREAFVAALEQLQDALGDLNDIAVHEEISKRLLESAAADGKRRGGRAKKAFAAGRLSGREESPNGPAAADEMMLACRRGAGQRAAGIVMPREISSRDARRTRQHDD